MAIAIIDGKCLTGFYTHVTDLFGAVDLKVPMSYFEFVLGTWDNVRSFLVFLTVFFKATFQ